MPTGDHLPHLPDPRGVESDLTQMEVRASSREAAIQLMLSYGMTRGDALAVYDAIFKLGFSSGRLEGYQEHKEESIG
jgi:hypothetical protein